MYVLIKISLRCRKYSILGVYFWKIILQIIICRCNYLFKVGNGWGRIKRLCTSYSNWRWSFFLSTFHHYKYNGHEDVYINKTLCALTQHHGLPVFVDLLENVVKLLDFIVRLHPNNSTLSSFQRNRPFFFPIFWFFFFLNLSGNHWLFEILIKTATCSWVSFFTLALFIVL